MKERRKIEVKKKKIRRCIFALWCILAIICNGVQREHNKKLNNGLPILHKVPPK